MKKYEKCGDSITKYFTLYTNTFTLAQQIYVNPKETDSHKKKPMQ